MKWKDKVEAAVDAFGCAIIDEAAERAFAQGTPVLRSRRARAALLALVTKGRCPRCGSDTVWCNPGEACTAELCGWTEDDAR
jgi:hypothetical protein